MPERLVSTSPANCDDEIGRYPIAEAADIDRAVAEAQEAFAAWRDVGAEARARLVSRFAKIVATRKADLALLIARETGKALWDARSEAELIAPKVTTSLNEGAAYTATVEAAPGARATFHPRGVLAVLGPFNFPAHLPNGHIVPALIAGNCVVFKPSEECPAVAEFLLACWKEAGLPRGVLSVIHGAGAVGRQLVAHTQIDAVLFTGSYSTGRSIREATLDQPWKLLALEMGGKNAMLVLEDADLELACSEAAFSVAVSTGQRCTCLSRIFVVDSLVEPFSDRLVDLLSALRIGAPLDKWVFMGPLINRRAHDKVMGFRALADDDGAERLLTVDPGRQAPFIGPGLVRFPDASQKTVYQREEAFGPEAAIYPVRDLEAGIEAVNDSDYGLAASVMTSSRSAYDACVGRIRTGILNWNKATVGASGKLPFGGTGKSGNDRPAGVTASVYCTVPQAHLESEGPLDPELLPPGFPRPAEIETSDD